MAKPIEIKLDEEGIGEILKSQELASFLGQVAEDIAGKAGPEFETSIEYSRRKTRYISHVFDPREGAMWREIHRGNLARAIGKSGG